MNWQITMAQTLRHNPLPFGLYPASRYGAKDLILKGLELIYKSEIRRFFESQDVVVHNGSSNVGRPNAGIGYSEWIDSGVGLGDKLCEPRTEARFIFA